MPALTLLRMERTREQIVEAAAPLFVGHGFDGTTMEAIAAASGVSVRTVFRYFPTKEDVVLAIGQVSWQGFLEALEAEPADRTELEAVLAAVEATLAPSWSDPDGVRSFMRFVHEAPAVRARYVERADETQRTLADVLARRAGKRRADLRHLVVAGSITTAITTALRYWAELPPGQVKPATTVDRALRALTEPVLR